MYHTLPINEDVIIMNKNKEHDKYFMKLPSNLINSIDAIHQLK